MRVLVGLGVLILLLGLLLGGCGRAPLPPPSSVAQGAGGLWQDAAILAEADRLIADAHDQLLVEMYEFGRADLRSALAAAAARGVPTRALLDPTVDVTAATGGYLAGAGVPVRWYPVDAARSQIDHVKLLVADGLALVAGMNWGARSGRNHDYALLLSGAAVGEAVAVFEHDWNLAGGLASSAPVWSPSGVLAETSPGESIRSTIAAALDAAPALVEIEMYSLTEPGLVVGLARRARAAASVRVILDPNQPENAATARLLQAGGVLVRRFRPPPGGKLHAKAGLFGGRLILGSANWTEHGLGINHELDATTTDAVAVAAFKSRFESDWASST